MRYNMRNYFYTQLDLPWCDPQDPAVDGPSLSLMPPCNSPSAPASHYLVSALWGMCLVCLESRLGSSTSSDDYFSVSQDSAPAPESLSRLPWLPFPTPTPNAHRLQRDTLLLTLSPPPLGGPEFRWSDTLVPPKSIKPSGLHTAQFLFLPHLLPPMATFSPPFNITSA